MVLCASSAWCPFLVTLARRFSAGIIDHLCASSPVRDERMDSVLPLFTRDLSATRGFNRGCRDSKTDTLYAPYCSASDDAESTPELAKINMQPKRASGEAQPQPFPDAPGAATFDAATRQLSIPSMPSHAFHSRLSTGNRRHRRSRRCSREHHGFGSGFLAAYSRSHLSALGCRREFPR
jgi:hypothetical protein